MNVRMLAEQLGLRILAGDAERQARGVYVCDLLSWVISHAEPDDVWITVMNNINVIAVASLADVSCVLIPENIEVETSVLERAAEKGITVLQSSEPAASLVVKIHSVLSSDAAS